MGVLFGAREPAIDSHAFVISRRASNFQDVMELSAVSVGGSFVSRVPLAGWLVLIVEDEPLIALEVERELRIAGARVVAAGYVESGLYTVEHPGLSAAVVDMRLGNEDGAAVCRQLRRRKVPFVIHTGYAAPEMATEWPGVTIIQKPASAGQIVRSLVNLTAG
jgi:ActR/RegA family two-component response regulator